MAKQISLLIVFSCLCAANALAQAKHVQVGNIDSLCNRIAEIKELPIKNDAGVDAAYDALIEAGDTVVPCLIEKITDTTMMRDPRCPQFSDRTKVGDVAYFVLIDIIKIGFVELLPPDVQQKYKTEGAYVYHDHIESKGARKQLQSKLREWYRQKHQLKSSPEPNKALAADRQSASLSSKVWA